MKKIFALCAAAAFCLCSANAFALDTNELLDTGVLEVAPYISLDNLHKDVKPGFTGEASLLYGIADFMTVSTTFTGYSEQAFASTGFGFNLQFLFTPLDTENIDIDFMTNFTYNGDFGPYEFNPVIEVNYDSDNDQTGWGAYLRFGLPVYSGPAPGDDPADEENGKIKSDVAITLDFGLYVSFIPDQQLFVEGGFQAVNLAENLGDAEIPMGHVGVGYNMTLFENFELTPEVIVNITGKKQGREAFASIGIGGVFDMVKIHE